MSSKTSSSKTSGKSSDKYASKSSDKYSSKSSSKSHRQKADPYTAEEMRAKQYWRVNAYEGRRSVAHLSRFNEWENIRGNPSWIQFTTPCPYQTIIDCYEFENGQGQVTTVNVPANSGHQYNIGYVFKSWMIRVNRYYG